ncbi:MAG: lamin tail domain-containing protein [Luteolibacter sp.]
MKTPPLAGFACLILASSCLDAAPVTIGDPSFEGNSLSAGGYSYNIGPEWTGTSGQSSSNAFEEYITGFAADGTDHLGMELSYDVWQDLGVTYQANTRYTLTVGCGNRSGNTQPGNQSEYHLADSTGTIRATGLFNASTIPVSTFADAPALVFDTPNDPDAIGKTIRILLRARGTGRSHFDNIRLDAQTLVPAGGATVTNDAATALTATSATLNGTVTSIGNAAPSITIFWGPQNGGIVAANWAHSVTLPGTWSGAFSTNLTGLTRGTPYYYAARATNSAGDSWAQPVGSFETPAQAATVANIAATDITPVSATVGAQVSDTGGEPPAVTIYYGTSDGGTGSWANSVPLGNLSTSATTTLSGLPQSSTIYFRTYAVNSGGSSWAPSSSSFTTPAITAPVVANDGADGITGTTATVKGKITSTGGSAPTVTLFYGTSDGGPSPDTWANSVTLGTQSGDFSKFLTGLSPSTAYSFRFRAVNGAGTAWSATAGTFSTIALVSATPVINEFHYKAADDTSLEEFIELYNPGDSDVSIAGWTLSSAVTYTFPAGVTIPAGGYVVACQDPSTMASKYGVTAWGPWSGNLNSSGEKIVLKDSGGTTIDSVDYKVGFPWPTGSAGAGSSAELINPGLDNDLGGSWRASGATVINPSTYIAAGASGWRYKKGTAEASSPVESWRDTAYNDSAWSTGAAGFGYAGGYTFGTTLSDMKGTGTTNYSTLYLRKSFTVTQVPQQLLLRLKYDDGCIVWINGHEVARKNVAAGQLAYTAVASADHTASTFEEVTIDNADDILVGGTNVIAIQALNLTKNSSDFFIDAEVKDVPASSPVPTPGAKNSVYQALNVVPPQIRQVAHTPAQPVTNQPVTITARITDPDGMGAVSVAYQTVDPGSYIRSTDAAYATGWTSVTMYDDGTHGDVTAGDSTYTAVIPGSVQTNRRLVRYKITFADALGNTATVPYADDEQKNFAYFVYDGLPSWQGSFRPGTTAVQTFSPSVLNTVPVYTMIANGTDVINCQYNSGYDETRFTATFVYDGVVYDNIQFRNRGEASTYVSGKNKWRFYFNRARDLVAKNNLGQPYAETWGSFSANACASPWCAVHRGMAGVEESVSFKAFQLAGVPSPNTHYYQFRIVRGATETPAAGTTVADPIGTADGQYAGDFWGLYMAIEQIDGSFLDERGLADGNVYKIENSAGDKKHQAPGQSVDSSDWNTFRDTGATTQTEAWWRANMDVNNYYTFHALNRLLGNVDLRGGYNHYYYHRSTDNRWLVIPWDVDMMFIPKRHWQTTINGTAYNGVVAAHKALVDTPALALEFRNRAREILDLMGSDNTTNGGQMGQLIDEFSQIVNPSGAALTIADADAAMWNMHPRTQGTDGNHSGQTNHKGNFYYSPFVDSRSGGSWTRWLKNSSYTGVAEHEDLMNYLRDYATNTWPVGSTWAVNNGDQRGYGYQYLASEAADASAPNKPVITYTGAGGYPVDGLSFSSSTFSTPGAGTYTGTQWRIAEMYAPGISGYVAGTARKYEIQSTWTLSNTGTTVQIPGSATASGKTYRARVRFVDSTGRTSSWSNPIQFTTGGAASTLVHYWNFNTATNNTTLITPTKGDGSLAIQLGTSDSAYLSGTGTFTGANARNGDAAASHLRLNNPVGDSLTFALPTTGYTNILVNFEAMRSSAKAAELQNWSYTTDGTNYVSFKTISIPQDTPAVMELDFRSIPLANNNPNFKLKLDIAKGTATGTGSDAGNQRVDNFTLTGFPIPGTYASWVQTAFSTTDQSNSAVSGPDADADGDGRSNFMEFALASSPSVKDLADVKFTWNTSGPNRYPALRFKRPEGVSGVLYELRASTDLVNWSTVSTSPATTTSLGSGIEEIVIRDTQTDALPKRFLRLRVTRVP